MNDQVKTAKNSLAVSDPPKRTDGRTSLLLTEAQELFQQWQRDSGLGDWLNPRYGGWKVLVERIATFARAQTAPTISGERRGLSGHAEIGLSLFAQLIRGSNALRDLDVFQCNQAEHEDGCECFWEQCEAWAATVPDQGSILSSLNCVLCHHNAVVKGKCVADAPICSNAYHGTQPCGCKCVFPKSTSKRRQNCTHCGGELDYVITPPIPEGTMCGSCFSAGHVDIKGGNRKGGRVCLVCPSTPSESTMTVEAALAELRKMFPGEPVVVEIHDYTNVSDGNGYISVSGGNRARGQGPTLAETMSAIRLWKEEQK